MAWPAIAPASLGLGVVGVVADQLHGDPPRLERAQPLQLCGRHRAADQHGQAHVMASGRRCHRDPVVAAGRGHKRGLGPALGQHRHLVGRPRSLERARGLDLLPLQSHVGRADLLGQCDARLQRRVNGDAAQARSRGIHVGQGGHAGHVGEVYGVRGRVQTSRGGRGGVRGGGLRDDEGQAAGSGSGAVDPGDGRRRVAQLTQPHADPHERAQPILHAGALDGCGPVSKRVVDLVLVPRRRGRQILDAAANGVVGALRQDRALGLEDVDVVGSRQPVQLRAGHRRLHGSGGPPNPYRRHSCGCGCCIASSRHGPLLMIRPPGPATVSSACPPDEWPEGLCAALRTAGHRWAPNPCRPARPTPHRPGLSVVASRPDADLLLREASDRCVMPEIVPPPGSESPSAGCSRRPG